ncbi:hypothetical protein ABTF77_20765, partial [Acinetobacter baumannii]
MSEAESSGLTNYQDQLAEMDQWFAKLSEMLPRFEDLERTSHGYVQRIAFFNEGAARTALSLQSELD